MQCFNSQLIWIFSSWTAIFPRFAAWDEAQSLFLINEIINMTSLRLSHISSNDDWLSCRFFLDGSSPRWKFFRRRCVSYWFRFVVSLLIPGVQACDKTDFNSEPGLMKSFHMEFWFNPRASGAKSPASESSSGDYTVPVDCCHILQYSIGNRCIYARFFVFFFDLDFGAYCSVVGLNLFCFFTYCAACVSAKLTASRDALTFIVLCLPHKNYASSYRICLSIFLLCNLINFRSVT